MTNTEKQFEPLTPQEKAKSGQRKQKTEKDEGRAIVPVPDGVALEIPRHSLGTPALVWDYRNALEQMLFRTCRFIPSKDEKEDRPLTYREYQDGSRRWAWKSLERPRPLYGLDRLAKSPNAAVLICEGEKATDAAQLLFPDLVVVTSPNGAQSPQCADWTPLQGRRVTIWPDHDDEGRQYAEAVARLVIQANVME